MADRSKLPREYETRSQTYYKHRVFGRYVFEWAVRLGRYPSRNLGPAQLRYCDCFSGPWESFTADGSDTSIAIALRKLAEAKEALAGTGRLVDIEALFLEDDDERFHQLTDLCDSLAGDIRVKCVHGRFQDHLDEIGHSLGEHPGLMFVDPTGWKNIRLRDLLSVADGRRDVLIRLPYEAYRFKTVGREEIENQIRDLFGIPEGEDMPRLPREADAMEYYCDQLRACGLLSGWMDIPDADSQRTAGWLVCAGRHPAVMEVFRNIEQEVVGSEALEIREQRSGADVQLSLDFGVGRFDRKYERHREWNREDLISDVNSFIRSCPNHETTLRDLCGVLLQRHHLTARELGDKIMGLVREGRLEIPDLALRQRVLKKSNRIRLPASAA